LTLKGEISERLRNNEPLQEIRGRFRSKSQFYEALTEYLTELTDKVETARTDLQQTQTELQETSAKRERLEKEKRELRNEVETLGAEKETLTADVESLRQEHDELQDDVTEIRSRGFTPEVVTVLKTALDKDGAEIADLLEVHEKSCELRKEVALLEQRRTGLTSEVRFLDEKRQKMRKKLASEENRLDRLEAQLAAFQDVVEILNQAIMDGYKPEQLKALLFWLRKLETDSEPGLSISHFLECLAEAKKLLVLKREAQIVEKRLGELTKAEVEVKAKVKIVQDVVLKGIGEAKTSGEQAIVSVGVQARDEVIRLASEFEAEIKTIANAASTTVASSIGETAKLQEQKAKLESLIQPAQILIGITDSSYDLKAVEPSLVATLLERFVLYCERRYPNAVINAMYNSVTQEFVVNPPLPTLIRISDLLKLAAEGIRKRMIQEEHEKQSH
jgi:myosin heavy subunit